MGKGNVAPAPVISTADTEVANTVNTAAKNFFI
jgi:hypothetical protein